MKKFFYLAENFNYQKGKPTIDKLNHLLECVGVQFNIGQDERGKKILIEVNEDKLKEVTTNKKAGRPKEHDLDFTLIQRMKKDGKTDKEIYTELGISKSLYYLRMKEYKNNIGH